MTSDYGRERAKLECAVFSMTKGAGDSTHHTPGTGRGRWFVLSAWTKRERWKGQARTKPESPLKQRSSKNVLPLVCPQEHAVLGQHPRKDLDLPPSPGMRSLTLRGRRVRHLLRPTAGRKNETPGSVRALRANEAGMLFKAQDLKKSAQVGSAAGRRSVGDGAREQSKIVPRDLE